MELIKADVRDIVVSPTTTEAAVAAKGSSHLFYHPRWLRLISEHYGYKLWKTSDPSGGYMLFAQVQGMLGPKFISLPFSDYTLPQVAPELLPLHLAALQQYFPKAPIILKCAALFAPGEVFSALGKPVEEACLHQVSLREFSARSMQPSFLRGVRKARRNGLKTECSYSEESLLYFYALYYRLRTERLKLIPQPFSFFERVFKQFIQTGEGFIYEVKKGGEVLASAIVLRGEKGLYYKWGCSSPDRLHLRPNNLLFHELLHLSSAMGYEFLDLGLSDLDEKRGLIRFKNSMGGQASAIYTWCICPDSYPLELEKKLKRIVNQVAGIVVDHKLEHTQTQAFSQVLYPLFV